MNDIILYIVIGINILAFILYGIDKYKAIHNKWRIKEIILLSLSLLSGSIGGLLGMFIFRHKTKHWYFYLVNILGLGVLFFILKYINIF